MAKKKKSDKESENNIINQEENSFFSLLTEFDISLFRAGSHFRLYEKLGAHVVQHKGMDGVYFAVWAPNAKRVSVVGNFNYWNPESHPMQVRWDSSGIWELFIPNIGKGEYYKFHVESVNGYSAQKADPFAKHAETPPHTASVVWDVTYKWSDKKWITDRKKRDKLHIPVSVYEVHLGSWRRKTEEGNRWLTYRELAEELPAYCKYMEYTHVEFLPVMEHPFYGSWGYQITGYFAPTSRYGTPEDFMYLIDELHKNGIGVILDWVPSHFPTDEHGLGYFDGTHLYEHEDPRKGFHQDWKSFVFNYSRNEVRSFLISNALYWLDKFHIDGLRVDAVASMLYLDYSRKEGEWLPNEWGGRENTDAIAFLRLFNQTVHEYFPDVITIAEESTAWPGVTAGVESGGLGFDMKWMMGWMHDTLYYFSKDPVYRSYHHQLMSFSIYYAFTEKFMLPLSHDEVVYGKGSLINKMPGDEWQKFANLRLLYTYMYMHPGSRLLFMGQEFAQWAEWNHDQSLNWDNNNNERNRGVQEMVRQLNRMYKEESALHNNFDSTGFEWIDFKDEKNCVLSWIRKSEQEELIFIANFTPVPLENYRIGVAQKGLYTEILNSDSAVFGGSGYETRGLEEVSPVRSHGRNYSLSLSLPPLGALVLKHIPSID